MDLPQPQAVRALSSRRSADPPGFPLGVDQDWTGPWSCGPGALHPGFLPPEPRYSTGSTEPNSPSVPQPLQVPLHTVLVAPTRFLGQRTDHCPKRPSHTWAVKAFRELFLRAP
eukprot:scaffold1748_cov258-Pinguiococcus_pyrenoidosus.AAC.14